MSPASGRTSPQPGTGDNNRAQARFNANCRALADAITKTGVRLRIALTPGSGAEPFLIHARYDIESRMHVYGEAETEAAIAGGLEGTGSTCREFLKEAAEAGGRLATPGIPPPVLWDEPALVIAGIAPGTVARWRKRRVENCNPRSGSA